MKYLWGYWKQHELANVCPKDWWELHEGARRTLRRIRRRPRIIAAFWEQAELPFEPRYIMRFSIGRSDLEDNGLITFKNRWGATRSELTYFRYVPSIDSKGRFRPPVPDWKPRIGRAVIPHLPDSILTAIGTIFYKHVG